jgi:hypothetical protein
MRFFVGFGVFASGATLAIPSSGMAVADRLPSLGQSGVDLDRDGHCFLILPRSIVQHELLSTEYKNSNHSLAKEQLQQ